MSRQEEKNGAVGQAAVSVLSHKSCGSETGGEQELLAWIRSRLRCFFWLGCGDLNKGPCCELNAFCSWQTLSAALQVELCLSASSWCQQPPFPNCCSAHPFDEEETSEKDKSKLWSGVLLPRNRSTDFCLFVRVCPQQLSWFASVKRNHSHTPALQ